ncbi:hypothetical protein [Polaribacter aquimarinus]|nr:hypothetical protein [Polaribacter aquimarinus]
MLSSPNNSFVKFVERCEMNNLNNKDQSDKYKEMTAEDGLGSKNLNEFCECKEKYSDNKTKKERKKAHDKVLAKQFHSDSLKAVNSIINDLSLLKSLGADSKSFDRLKNVCSIEKDLKEKLGYLVKKRLLK